MNTFENLLNLKASSRGVPQSGTTWRSSKFNIKLWIASLLLVARNDKSWFIKGVIILFFLFSFSPTFLFAGEIEDALKDRLNHSSQMKSSAWMKDYYLKREYKPVWNLKENDLKKAAQMLKSIDAAKSHGLNPNNYRHEEISRLISEKIDERGLIDLELILTDSFFLLGSHLSAGIINPFSFNAIWLNEGERERLTGLLNDLSGSESVEAVFAKLYPSNPEYAGLMKALLNYEALLERGGWNEFPKKWDKKLEPGMHDERVKALRSRLQSPSIVEDELLYDDALQKAVIEFQLHNGLKPDGVVGKFTVQALSTSVDDRICQMKIGLDRLRSLSRLFSDDDYIFVNIPDFYVKVFQSKKSVLEMKAIVGRPSRKTPMMKGKVGYIIFSPKWHIPKTILMKDKIPEAIKNPEFFKKHRMKVYLKGEGVFEEVDSTAVDWSTVDESNNPYMVVQDPGDDNALGRIKFIFPNKDDVYMHDTPTKNLFDHDMRLYSSGCVRIEKPVELGTLLLRDQAEFTVERIGQLMHMDHERVVYLTNKIPVYLLYLTAWADSDGSPQFRFDVYGYDKKAGRTICD